MNHLAKAWQFFKYLHADKNKYRKFNVILITAIIISIIEYISNIQSAFYINTYLKIILLSFCLVIFILDFLYQIHKYRSKNKHKVESDRKEKYLVNLPFKKIKTPPFFLIVDFLCLVSLVLSIARPRVFDSDISIFIDFLGIFRIWKIGRYFDEFGAIKKGFEQKKVEIINSLVGIILLSFTISAAIYYFEMKTFKSIWDAFIWSIAKYTEDYAQMTNGRNITSAAGKILATINGLLGIALFALPAGLLASAFIDEIAEGKKNKEFDKNYRIIMKYLNKKIDLKYIEKKQSKFKYIPKIRFVTFPVLQGKLLLSETEIFQAIRKNIEKYRSKERENTDKYRDDEVSLKMTHVKSDPDNNYYDLNIIVAYTSNTNYGYVSHTDQITKNKIILISPSGDVERFIDHFTFSIYKTLDDITYVSRNKRITTIDETIETTIGANKSKYYSIFSQNNLSLQPIKTNPPNALKFFIEDINDRIGEATRIAIIISSASAENTDFVYEFGDSFYNDKSDIIASDKIKRYEDLRSRINDSIFQSKFNKHDTNSNFSVSEIKNKYRTNSDSLMNNIQHNHQDLDILYIGINIKVLAAKNKVYFNAMMTICDLIQGLK